MKKADVADIHPLSFMQQSLLMHHLHEKEDHGLIQVRCKLHGKLSRDLFHQSWKEVFKHHPALRTSVHWENIKKPVQVVHRNFDIPFQLLNLEDVEIKEISREVKKIIQKDRDIGLDLRKVPLSRITLIQIGHEEFLLIWTCHHILLDGWSSAIVLRQVLICYESFCHNNPYVKADFPSFFNYLLWIKKQPLEKAELFWNNYLSRFEEATIIQSKDRETGSDAQFEASDILLERNRTNLINDYVKKEKISLSIFFEGLWAIIIHSLISRQDIIFGLTTSGRAVSDFNNIEGVVGMLMNVLPLRVTLKSKQSFTELCKSIQETQAEILQYDFLNLSQILHFKNWSTNISLFNSLFVFENFPQMKLKGGSLEVEEFESDITATYPLTLMIKPESQIHINLNYDKSIISERLVNSILDNLSRLIDLIIREDTHDISKLKDRLSFPEDEIYFEQQTRESISKLTDLERMRFSRNVEGANISRLVKRKENIDKYESPKDNLQLGLSQIWEELFGWYPIGINDDFFKIGGTSMMAIQLFVQIEKHFNYSLPPTTLLANPTIKSLAEHMSDGKHKSWAALIPLRKEGKRNPLFCLHAGGAHVLFYNDLAKHLSQDQPVYAIQPVGLDGLEKAHETIEEMASYYIKEIQQIQPEGPYALLGTCFSDALGIEMAIQLNAMGQTVEPLIIVDSTPMGIEPDEITTKTKIQGYLEILRKGNFPLIFHMIKLKWNSIFSPEPKEEDYRHLSDIDKNQLGNLATIRKSLYDLYEKYQWKMYEGKVTYIQSDEYHTKPWVRNLVTTWQKVALGGVEMLSVPGRHYSLFEEPEVIELAKQVDQCMIEAFQKTEKGLVH